jgi:hypothetical protein
MHQLLLANCRKRSASAAASARVVGLENFINQTEQVIYSSVLYKTELH